MSEAVGSVYGHLHFEPSLHALSLRSDVICVMKILPLWLLWFEPFSKMALVSLKMGTFVVDADGAGANV